MLKKIKQNISSKALFVAKPIAISSSYRGQTGKPGDIVYLNEDGFQIANIENLNYFVNSGEFSTETIQTVLNLIAYLNNNKKIVKVFNENCWVSPTNKQSVRIVFAGFPKTDGITYAIEND